MSVTNERLCHEIILDPTYRIPGSSQEEEEGNAGVEGESNPALDHAKKIQEQMKRVFWDGLIVSLTPPAQESAKDFVAGADVQVRYGANGAYYSASIVEVTDEGSDDEDDDENGEGESENFLKTLSCVILSNSEPPSSPPLNPQLFESTRTMSNSQGTR